VGVALQTDGSLKVDQTKMNKALDQLDAVAQLFTRDEEGTAQDGVAVRIESLVKALTGTDGTIDSKQTSLRAVLRRNQQDQTRMEDRLADVEKRLKARYTALDNQMSSLNGLGAYVARQFGPTST
jgi:flagellar hook-associated protein 2